MGGTIAYCRCDARRAAEAFGSFRYVPAIASWVFPDGQRRWMSSTAHFRAFVDRSEYDHVDHTGEPYRHVECPWCGGWLPGQPAEPVKEPPPNLAGDGPE